MKSKLTVENNAIEQLPLQKCSILVSTLLTRKFLLIFSFNNSESINQEGLLETPKGTVVGCQQIAITVMSPNFSYLNPLYLAQKPRNKLLSPEFRHGPRSVSSIEEIAKQYIPFYKLRLLGINIRFSCLRYFYFSYSFILIFHLTFINYINGVYYFHFNSITMINGGPESFIAHGEQNKKLLGKYG